MKKSILSLLMVLCIVSVSSAAEITLTWDRSAESDVTGYNVFRGSIQTAGDASGPLTNIATVLQTADGTAPEYIDTVNDGDKVIYCVTAVDSVGRTSDPSNFAFWPVPYVACPECHDCSDAPIRVLNLKVTGNSDIRIEGTDIKVDVRRE